MIQSLAMRALQNNVPFAVIYGVLRPGATAKSSQAWGVHHINGIRWRPAGVGDFVFGRLVPLAPLPSFDQAEVNHSLAADSGSFAQQQQHRIGLRVPQAESFIENSDAYQRALEVAHQAVDVFESLASQNRNLRILTIPSAYSVLGAMRDPTFTMQHLPICLEDVQNKQIVWVHPEAESLVEGHQLGDAHYGLEGLTSAAIAAPVPAVVRQLIQEALPAPTGLRRRPVPNPLPVPIEMTQPAPAPLPQMSTTRPVLTPALPTSLPSPPADTTAHVRRRVRMVVESHEVNGKTRYAVDPNLPALEALLINRKIRTDLEAIMSRAIKTLWRYARKDDGYCDRALPVEVGEKSLELKAWVDAGCPRDRRPSPLPKPVLRGKGAPKTDTPKPTPTTIASPKPARVEEV